MELTLIETSEDVQPGNVVALAPSAQVQGPLAGALAFLQNGGNTEQLERMMAIQERWEAAEAKKAFTAAVAAFKLSPPKVYKDKTNNQYKSTYNSIGNTVNTVNAALSAHGLSANWTIKQQPAWVEVTCTLTHERGHSESCSMGGPPDGSGNKNALQQVKSSVTYLKLATYEAITGIASEEANLDDDGNASGAKQIDPELLQRAREASLKGWKALADFTKGLTEQQRKELEPESVALKEAAKKVPA